MYNNKMKQITKYKLIFLFSIILFFLVPKGDCNSSNSNSNNDSNNNESNINDIYSIDSSSSSNSNSNNNSNNNNINENSLNVLRVDPTDTPYFTYDIYVSRSSSNPNVECGVRIEESCASIQDAINSYMFKGLYIPFNIVIIDGIYTRGPNTITDFSQLVSNVTIKALNPGKVRISGRSGILATGDVFTVKNQRDISITFMDIDFFDYNNSGLMLVNSTATLSISFLRCNFTTNNSASNVRRGNQLFKLYGKEHTFPHTLSVYFQDSFVTQNAKGTLITSSDTFVKFKNLVFDKNIDTLLLNTTNTHSLIENSVIKDNSLDLINFPPQVPPPSFIYAYNCGIKIVSTLIQRNTRGPLFRMKGLNSNLNISNSNVIDNNSWSINSLIELIGDSNIILTNFENNRGKVGVFDLIDVRHMILENNTFINNYGLESIILRNQAENSTINTRYCTFKFNLTTAPSFDSSEEVESSSESLSSSSQQPQSSSQQSQSSQEQSQSSSSQHLPIPVIPMFFVNHTAGLSFMNSNFYIETTSYDIPMVNCYYTPLGFSFVDYFSKYENTPVLCDSCPLVNVAGYSYQCNKQIIFTTSTTGITSGGVTTSDNTSGGSSATTTSGSGTTGGGTTDGTTTSSTSSTSTTSTTSTTSIPTPTTSEAITSESISESTSTHTGDRHMKLKYKIMVGLIVSFGLFLIIGIVVIVIFRNIKLHKVKAKYVLKTLKDDSKRMNKLNVNHEE